MDVGKKIWFKAFGPRFWIPVSWEGWAVTAVLALGMFLIFSLNGMGEDVPFSLKERWPALVEVVVLVFAGYRFTQGHVERLY